MTFFCALAAHLFQSIKQRLSVFSIDEDTRGVVVKRRGQDLLSRIRSILLDQNLRHQVTAVGT